MRGLWALAGGRSQPEEGESPGRGTRDLALGPGCAGRSEGHRGPGRSGGVPAGSCSIRGDTRGCREGAGPCWEGDRC